MAKISIYLDDFKLQKLDLLVASNPLLSNRSRSALISLLIDQEIARATREQMVKAAAAFDELNLGWEEEEIECAIIDAEVSG